MQTSKHANIYRTHTRNTYRTHHCRTHMHGTHIPRAHAWNTPTQDIITGRAHDTPLHETITSPKHGTRARHTSERDTITSHTHGTHPRHTMTGRTQGTHTGHTITGNASTHLSTSHVGVFWIWRMKLWSLLHSMDHPLRSFDRLCGYFFHHLHRRKSRD